MKRGLSSGLTRWKGEKRAKEPSSLFPTFFVQIPFSLTNAGYQGFVEKTPPFCRILWKNWNNTFCCRAPMRKNFDFSLITQAWPHQQLSSLLSVYYHLFQFSIIFCNFECWLRVLLRITYSTSVIIPLSVLENTAANGVTPPLSVTSREDGECSITKAHHHHHHHHHIWEEINGLENWKKIVVKILTPQKPAESQVVIASSVMQGRRPLGVNSPGGNTPMNKMIGNLKRNATKHS